MNVPPQLQAEHDALIAEIYAAFDGVTRDGGVSWSETEIIDEYGSEKECGIARLKDQDRSWTELAEDSSWDAGPGMGGWPFLDKVGFRYYLPAAMVRILKSGDDASTCYSLDFTLTLNKATKPGGFRLRDWTLDRWSLLTDRQCRCVARFIRYMIAYEESTVRLDLPEYEAEDWRKAYDRYWNRFE